MATKEAADNNDHSLLFSTSLLLPFRLAERLLASPFLKQPSILPLLIVAPEMGPLFFGCAEHAQLLTFVAYRLHRTFRVTRSPTSSLLVVHATCFRPPAAGSPRSSLNRPLAPPVTVATTAPVSRSTACLAVPRALWHRRRSSSPAAGPSRPATPALGSAVRRKDARRSVATPCARSKDLPVVRCCSLRPIPMRALYEPCLWIAR
jgi:hypothetical protein